MGDYSSTALREEARDQARFARASDGSAPGIPVMGAPPEYRNWLGNLPEGVIFEVHDGRANCDVVRLFVGSFAALRRTLPTARQSIGPAGATWVCWHKKTSGVPTDINEDVVRGLALKTDLVDVKVCAVTDIWSGLKLVVRRHLR